MAYATSMVWEARTTGDAANGGGFDATSGTPGTDYSQQDAAEVAYTDLVIDGTTNTNCTSAATPFTSAHVGNVINITSGTGFTVQRVQIMSVAAGVATCDKSLGTLSSTGGVGNLGGALTLDAAITSVGLAAGNTLWIAGGTYTNASDRTMLFSGSLGDWVKIRGYNTTRGDSGTQPLITSATSNVELFLLTGTTHNGFSVELINLNLTHTGGTRGAAFSGNGATSTLASVRLTDCDVNGCLNGVYGGASSRISRCIMVRSTIRNCTGRGVDAVNEIELFSSMVFDNGGDGLNAGAGISKVYLHRSIVAYNAGVGAVINTAANRATDFCADNSVLAFNTGNGFYNAGTDGSSGSVGIRLHNSIIYGNGGYGGSVLNSLAVATKNTRVAHTCALGDNTSGNWNNLADCVDQITLTADPFTDAVNGDFSLNNTAGGGALLRALGMPGVFAGGLTTGYADVGAVQHEDTGSAPSLPTPVW